MRYFPEYKYDGVMYRGISDVKLQSIGSKSELRRKIRQYPQGIYSFSRSEKTAKAFYGNYILQQIGVGLDIERLLVEQYNIYLGGTPFSLDEFEEAEILAPLYPNFKILSYKGVK
jgi:hypothetical protein